MILPRRVQLRTLLALVVLTTTVSFGLFAGWLIYRSQGEQEEVLNQQNVVLARAVSSAVDGEVQSSLNALTVLTTLEQFGDVALRLARTQEHWHAVLLADGHGREILNVSGARASAASGQVKDWARTVLATRQPYISDLIHEGEPGRFFYLVAIPVIRDGTADFALGAMISTQRLSDVLQRQSVPDGAVLTLIDRNRRVMARTLDEDRLIGTLPAPDFVNESRRTTDGFWNSRFLDGEGAYAALKTSSTTGWTVGFGLPFEVIKGPRRHNINVLIIVGLCLLAVGAWSVLLLARGVVPPLHRASGAAALLARGEPLPPLRSRIAEVAQLFEGLRGAEVTLRARRAERDAALQSEQTARREAEEANRLKDEFLMAVSHELRTPLTAIRGWARMLHTGEIADGQRARAVETIERNAHLLAQLVDDLLDVSQGEAGKLRLDLRRIALDEVAHAALDTIRPAAVAKALLLTVDVHDHCDVLGDPDRLQQVIWNVLANAVKFTPSGGTVSLAMVRRGVVVDLTVTDSGPGIDAEFLPFAFDPFRQASGGRVRVNRGVGLGLAIVRQLTELHGGTVVAFNNSPGAGATVRLSFPIVVLSAADHEADAAATDAEGHRQHPASQRVVL